GRVSPGRARHAAPDSRRGGRSLNSRPGPTSHCPMKLLLIGDERKNRRMFAWGFSSDPYRVRMARSCAGVGELLAVDSFHAACVDLKMQEDNGIGIVEYLHRRLPGLPIVALGGEKDRKLVAG